MNILKKQENETNREYVYRLIEQNIVSLELKPGTLISENEIASQLHLSRTPVREAIIELSRFGLLEVLPQKGTRVALIDYAMIDEANFLRLALERSIVEYACTHVKELSFDALEENLSLTRFYVERNNKEKIYELDNEFHRLLFTICHKPQCYKYMKSMSAHFDRVRNMSLTMLSDIHIYEEHLKIYDAIRQGDTDRALKLMTDHLSTFKVHEIELKKLHPEYFI